jgi:hypothetical protein
VPPAAGVPESVPPSPPMPLFSCVWWGSFESPWGYRPDLQAIDYRCQDLHKALVFKGFVRFLAFLATAGKR